MIYTNTFSVFLLRHHLNGLRNENLCLVQEVMRAIELDADKYKNVYENYPNLAILAKSSTPGEIQLTFSHAAVGNNSMGESVVAFALSGDLSSPSVISFNIESAFATDGKNIRLPIADVLLRAAAGDLARSNKQPDWTSRNAVLLPLFLTYQSDAGELLQIFACYFTECASYADP